jgi:hypothetical protein
MVGDAGDLTISQRAVIPLPIRSVFFKSESRGILIGPQLTINGGPLSYQAIVSTPEYTLFGVDITRLAGQAATVAFTGKERIGGFRLDSIQFSTQSVPESGTRRPRACLASFLFNRRRDVRG